MSHSEGRLDKDFHELMTTVSSFASDLNHLQQTFKEVKEDFKTQSIRNDERLDNLQKTNQEAIIMLAQLLNIKDDVRKNTEWRLGVQAPLQELLESRQLHMRRLWDNIYKYGFIFLAGAVALGVTAFIVGK